MPHDSLIQRAAQQPALFDAEMEEKVFAASEGRGEFTAERLFERRPATYQAVVKLLGLGHGQIRIGDILSVSPSTVRAVARREGVVVGIEKRALAEQAWFGARLAQDVLLDLLSDPEKRAELTALDAAKIMALITDRALVLSGEASVIVETKTPVKPGHEDFNAYIESLPSAAPGLGSGAEKNGAQGLAALPPAGAPGVEPAAPGSEGGADGESGGNVEKR